VKGIEYGYDSRRAEDVTDHDIVVLLLLSGRNEDAAVVGKRDPYVLR